jgi:hypothetical protein
MVRGGNARLARIVGHTSVTNAHLQNSRKNGSVVIGVDLERPIAIRCPRRRICSVRVSNASVAGRPGRARRGEGRITHKRERSNFPETQPRPQYKMLTASVSTTVCCTAPRRSRMAGAHAPKLKIARVVGRASVVH